MQQATTSSSNKFGQNSLCHYQVLFPNSAGAGDANYINVIILRNVQTNIVIAKSINDPYVTVCSGVQAGEYLLAQYPYNFYITFVSQSSDSTPFFYLNTFYSTYQTQQTVNSIRCYNVSNTPPSATPSPPSKTNTTNTSVAGNNKTYGPTVYKGYYTFSEIQASQIAQMEQNAINRKPLSNVKTIYSPPATANAGSKPVNVFAVAVLVVGSLFTLCGVATIVNWASKNRERLCRCSRRNEVQPRQEPEVQQ